MEHWSVEESKIPSSAGLKRLPDHVSWKWSNAVPENPPPLMVFPNTPVLHYSNAPLL